MLLRNLMLIDGPVGLAIAHGTDGLIDGNIDYHIDTKIDYLY